MGEPSCSAVSKGPCLSESRAGRAQPCPWPRPRLSRGREGGVVRPAARQRARTRPAWTTTPNGRRLPLDRLGRGCVADRKTKRLRTGVSGRKPVDPPERRKDHPGPRRARASPVSSACRSSQTGRQLSLCSTDSLQLPARLTTGCLLDPCGLAYSLLRPCASTPKVVPAQGWTTGLTARVSGPARRDEMGRAGRPGPAGEGLARDETGIRTAQPGASP